MAENTPVRVLPLDRSPDKTAAVGPGIKMRKVADKVMLDIVYIEDGNEYFLTFQLAADEAYRMGAILRRETISSSAAVVALRALMAALKGWHDTHGVMPDDDAEAIRLAADVLAAADERSAIWPMGDGDSE